MSAVGRGGCRMAALMPPWQGGSVRQPTWHVAWVGPQRRRRDTRTHTGGSHVTIRQYAGHVARRAQPPHHVLHSGLQCEVTEPLRHPRVVRPCEAQCAAGAGWRGGEQKRQVAAISRHLNRGVRWCTAVRGGVAAAVGSGVRWRVRHAAAHTRRCVRRGMAARGGAPRASAAFAPPFSGEHSASRRKGTAAVAGRCPIARSHKEMRQVSMGVLLLAGGKGSCLSSEAKRPASCKRTERGEGGGCRPACGPVAGWLQAGCRPDTRRVTAR